MAHSNVSTTRISYTQEQLLVLLYMSSCKEEPAGLREYLNGKYLNEGTEFTEHKSYLSSKKLEKRYV